VTSLSSNESDESFDTDTTQSVLATTPATSAVMAPLQTNPPKPKEYVYHCPPSNCNNVDTFYEANDTVFGSILRGELPAVTLAESDRLVAFQDKRPRAPLHALIIPKVFVGSIFDVQPQTKDIDDMRETYDMALRLLQTHQPKAFQEGDYRLVYHVPPFNSVNHLHLHVLAPVSEMSFYYKYIKYLPFTRWCISMDNVMERLMSGQSSVPYRRPPCCILSS